MQVHTPADLRPYLDLLLSTEEQDEWTTRDMHRLLTDAVQITEGVHSDVYYARGRIVKIAKHPEQGLHEIAVHRMLPPSAHVAPLERYIVSDPNDALQYVVLVFPYVRGSTMDDWMGTVDVDAVGSVLLQVVGWLASLPFAYRHNDLHTRNIMVEPCDHETTFALSDGTRGTVASLYRAVVIDHALANVCTHAAWCAHPTLADTTPAHDVFKLLASTYRSAQRVFEQTGAQHATMTMTRYLLNRLFSPPSEPTFCGDYVHHDVDNPTFQLLAYWIAMRAYADDEPCEDVTYARVYHEIEDYFI
jgi:hypothetical protein